MYKHTPEPLIRLVEHTPFGIKEIRAYATAKDMVREMNKKFKESNFSLRVPEILEVDCIDTLYELEYVDKLSRNEVFNFKLEVVY